MGVMGVKCILTISGCKWLGIASAQTILYVEPDCSSSVLPMPVLKKSLEHYSHEILKQCKVLADECVLTFDKHVLSRHPKDQNRRSLVIRYVEEKWSALYDQKGVN